MITETNDSNEAQDIDDADLESVTGGVREGGCVQIPDLVKVKNPFGGREAV